jgi:hypothetical protein
MPTDDVSGFIAGVAKRGSSDEAAKLICARFIRIS